MQKDIINIIEAYKRNGGNPLLDKVRIQIPDAESKLRGWLDGVVRKISCDGHAMATWSEENYRPVVDWMTDNKGRGLLMTGGCGLGKTLIGKHILPLIILGSCRKVVTITSSIELGRDIDEILAKKLIYIDDVGTESLSKVYGNVRCPFEELVDAAEQQGKLLIITTNLTPKELCEKYGERTLDRLKAITKFVPFTGRSLRK